jgi:hypothetical protein
MGETAAQTVAEIEETRGRLEEDIRELEGRLPAPATWAKRLIGVAVGGGAGAAAFWFAVRRVRKHRKAKAQAVPVQAVVNVLPEHLVERLSEAVDDGRWKGWLAGAGGVWLLVRLAELRQLRRMNRVLAVRPPS